jgi:tetratricopeptide (TPR) repeat protein
MGERLTEKILLVGWDGADWNVIRPLMNQGKLPHLTRLLDEGISGNLRSLHPHHSPMVWTSIATGKRPYKTGVCGYAEVCPDGLDVRPITSYSRRSKAIWNISSQSGLRTHCVNWYASDPAETVKGIYVSRGFFSPQESAGTDRNSGPLFRGKQVHPVEISGLLSRYLIDSTELDPTIVLELLPAGARVDDHGHPRLQWCAQAMAETASVHAVACEIIQQHPFDFMAVLYTGLERFSHLLMPYHPPRQSHISEREFELYHQGLSVAYQLHDMMLGRLVELAGEDTTVLVVSDHGFKVGPARCDRSPDRSIEAAIASHDSQGILVMRGQHIVRDDTIEGANILDVTPTILALLGLPFAGDLDGRPLHEAIDVMVSTDTIPSWDQQNSGGSEGNEWEQAREPAIEIDERLHYLVELGYREAPSAEARQRIERTRNDNTYNLAGSFIDARKTDRAIPLLESLVRIEPYRADLSKSLFEAYHQAGRISDAKAIVQRFCDIGERGPLIHLGFAWVSLAERRPVEALEHLEEVAHSTTVLPGVQLLVGQAYLRLREWDLAEKAFTAELELNGNSEMAWGGLAIAAAGKQHYQAAAEHALQAVGLKPDYLAAHYHLGLSLCGLGRHTDAANAFKRCLEIDPTFTAAYRSLIGLYEGPLWNPEQALAYRQRKASSLNHRDVRRPPNALKGWKPFASSSS